MAAVNCAIITVQ